MSSIGNFLWFISGGVINGLSWALMGCLWCITIVGIPLGKQCFKLASVSFFPFKKEVEYGGGAVSLFVNIIWMLFTGLPLALEHIALGVLFFITIIGIPFGKQEFKLAKLALMPFGAKIKDKA